MPQLRRCGHSARAVVTAAVVSIIVCAGCSGGSSTPEASQQAIFITSHQDRATVSGAITLRGTAPGPIEVSVDDGAFAPADGAPDWSFGIDTETWTLGWHTVRVRTQGESIHINLYSENGYVEPPVVIDPGPQPPPPPPTRGLVAHWDFSDGLALDRSGNEIDGTVLGNPAWSGGNSMSFDAIDDEVRVSDPGLLADLVCGTINIRFKFNELKGRSGVGEVLPLLYYGANDATMQQRGWDCVTIYISHGELFNPERRQIYFTALSGDQIKLCFDTTVTLEPDRWYDYCVVLQAGDHRAYLDGKQVELTYNANTSPDTHVFFKQVEATDMFSIGYGYFGFFDSWWRFDGEIDDVRIYDRPLSKFEVMALASEA